jgi:excisionase family DNA binding protein
MTDSENTLLTRTEAAAYLGVSKGTLEVWACTKRYALPYVKIGRLVKYRLCDLQAFVVARTVSTESA